MESAIKEYISRELVSDPELLLLENNTPLLAAGIPDSLSVLKLVLFFDEQFGIVVSSEDVIPEHFETIKGVCTYLRAQQQVQGVQE